MRAGPLDKLVTFQRRAAGLDAYGQRSGAWEDVAIVWAAIRPLSTSERARAASVVGTVSHEITVRFDSRLVGVDDVAGWRIALGARTFNPGPPRNVDEQDRALVFDCTEGGGDE